MTAQSSGPVWPLAAHCIMTQDDVHGTSGLGCPVCGYPAYMPPTRCVEQMSSGVRIGDV